MQKKFLTKKGPKMTYEFEKTGPGKPAFENH